jgi:hypothetical protein
VDGHTTAPGRATDVPRTGDAPRPLPPPLPAPQRGAAALRGPSLHYWRHLALVALLAGRTPPAFPRGPRCRQAPGHPAPRHASHTAPPRPHLPRMRPSHAHPGPCANTTCGENTTCAVLPGGMAACLCAYGFQGNPEAGCSPRTDPPAWNRERAAPPGGAQRAGCEAEGTTGSLTCRWRPPCRFATPLARLLIPTRPRAAFAPAACTHARGR